MNQAKIGESKSNFKRFKDKESKIANDLIPLNFEWITNPEKIDSIYDSITFREWITTNPDSNLIFSSSISMSICLWVMSFLA